VNGTAAPVAVKKGRGGDGITSKAARIIRALVPIRDAVREVLRAQAADRPWAQAQVRLRVAYSAFVRYFGPINHTVVAVTTDPETGEERETHRRPNLAPFADDPDCWLVASIEDDDLESGLARMGPVFRDRVISPPARPVIASAAAALAVTLDETGRVDPEHLAELLECEPDTALSQLGAGVFRNPLTQAWETADAYLSGPVRTKLAAAEAAAALDRQYERNLAALREVQPQDIRPSDHPANQFALAKAIASGDARLIQKAGLETEIARLERQRAAHFDDQLNIRRQIQNARHDRDTAEKKIAAIREDPSRRVTTGGEAFALEGEGRGGSSASAVRPGPSCSPRCVSLSVRAPRGRGVSEASAASIWSARRIRLSPEHSGSHWSCGALRASRKSPSSPI
jgi:hypothetical protein